MLSQAETQGRYYFVNVFIANILTLFMLNNFLNCLPKAFFGSVRTWKDKVALVLHERVLK
jgi:hypothetical protein